MSNKSLQSLNLNQVSPSNSTLKQVSVKGTQKQLASKDSSQIYLYMRDQRTEQERQMQHQAVQQIYKNNLKTLHINLTEKKKVEYQPSRLIKVQVGNNWYAMITDNQANAQFTIFTVHGAPGDHREWAGLETQTKVVVRWINLIIPGFDGLDQRRGNYSGSAQDLSKLIILVLQQRKVQKIIYCGHSLGSIFGSYFMNKYSHVIAGYINITGIVNQWYVGLLTFYHTVLAKYGFSKGPTHRSMFRLLNNDQYRIKHHKRFITDSRQIYFHAKVPFPQLTVTQMCAYIKLIGSMPKGCSQFYQYNHKLRLLRVLIFGKDDPIHEQHKVQQQIYSITKGRFRFDKYPQNARLTTSMKKQLQQTILQIHGIKIQAQKLQQYFCYHFDETGHNAHKRRPKQMSIIIKVYITVLKVMNKYKPLTQTRL